MITSPKAVTVVGTEVCTFVTLSNSVPSTGVSSVATVGPGTSVLTTLIVLINVVAASTSACVVV